LLPSAKEAWARCVAPAPRLNRDVAIKVSAHQFTYRFEREANAPASLNHSNICALFDVGPARLWPTRSRPTENQPRSLSRKLSVKESVTAPKREHEAIFLQSFVGEMLRRAPVGESRFLPVTGLAGLYFLPNQLPSVCIGEVHLSRRPQ
jgi:hypothetical protein